MRPFEQDLVPKAAANELGLPKNSNILFFAGGAGDWAHCLATGGCKVRFTDISGQITAKVSGKYPKSFCQIKCADAYCLPEKNTDETLVSFEPVPLYKKDFVFFLLRAVALSKRVVIVQRAYLFPNPYFDFLFLSDLFSLPFECGYVSFLCRRPGKKRFVRTSLVVYSIEAKADGRKMMPRRFLKNGKPSKEFEKRNQKAASALSAFVSNPKKAILRLRGKYRLFYPVARARTD